MNEPYRLRDETRDFIFEFVRQAPDRQARDAEALDAKTVQVFAAGSVVLGLTVAGQVVQGTAAWLVGAAVICYLVAVIAAVVELWVRRFRTSEQPDQLWRRYWADEVGDVKHAILADLSAGYPINRRVLFQKRVALLVSLVATGAEAILVAVALIVSLA